MTAREYPRLASRWCIGSTEIANRLVFGPHSSGLWNDEDAYLAYLEARAKSGTGLIIAGFAGVHPSGRLPRGVDLSDEAGAEKFSHIVRGLTPYDTKLFVQLGHMGGHANPFQADGSRARVWGVSEGHTGFPATNAVVQELPHDLIPEIVAAFATAAGRAKSVGLDGVEVCACNDTLPASFLAQKVNRRNDEYGGSLENRLRFLREICEAIRETVGEDFPVGARISAEDNDNIGMELDEALEIFETLDREALVDFLHIGNGGEGSRRGLMLAVAPMSEHEAFVAPYAAAVKARVRVPLIVAGRFNQPQAAEAIIERGEADAVSVVRGQIADAEFVSKVLEGRSEDIRACVGCNQACLGHVWRGAPVGCIQNPQAGRERQYPDRAPASSPRKVLVVGGGPAGMQAAALAAERGHDVTLCEAASRLGGQVQLAQRLPGREEFGGVVTNFERELGRSAAEVRLKTRVDRAFVEKLSPEAIVVATGGQPAVPEFEREDRAHVCTAWDILRNEGKPGTRVIVADLFGDWVAPGVAEKLVGEGHQVRLATLQPRVGEAIAALIGDYVAGRMFELGIETIPYARLFGMDEDTVYFEHCMALKPIVCEGVDTLVLCYGNRADRELAAELEGLDIETHYVGDCRSPRTAEEAILEGYEVAASL